jgi:hypothetical protein
MILRKMFAGHPGRAGTGRDGDVDSPGQHRGADFDFGFSRCREAPLTGGSVALGAVAARVQLLTDRRDCPNG